MSGAPDEQIPVRNRLPHRVRLPNRRPSVTATLNAAGQVFDASVGFDAEGRPRELFLAAPKPGSTLDGLLADAAVVVSVALQHGVPVEVLTRSIGRVSSGPISPADLDRPKPERLAASPLGAALDLIRELEPPRPVI